MKIESILVENYKAFKNAYIENLSNLVVLLGLNGSGKSTFFDIFGFLHDALQNNVTIAVNKRGGFKEVISRGCDIHKDLIKFEIKFRDLNQDTKHPPLITYLIEIGYENGKCYINREILKYRRGRKGQPWHFLDFSKGSGKAIENESEYGHDDIQAKRIDQKVTSSDILAIKGLGQFEQFKTISTFRNLLEKWYISNFKIESSRTISDTGMDSHLSETGENLAQVTKYMYENHRGIFDDLLQKLPQRIPGIHEVQAKETDDGRIILRFKDENFQDPFVSRYVSDGTLKMFAYMVLLNDPEPHPLLCIEEPENFLHPDILPELCKEIREYAERGGQVFVSTHSPDFVDHINIDELFFITKSNGYSTIHSAKDAEMVRKLVEERNTLGWLWRNHYIKGANL